MTLRGINVQLLFSQLLLQGVKTEEVRTYDTPSYMNEDFWLVETPDKSDALRNAVCTPGPLPPRPLQAQTVGIIRFRFKGYRQ